MHMNAPKRSRANLSHPSSGSVPRQPPNQPISAEQAHEIESIKKWIANFKRNTDYDPTARRAWKMLVSEGLDAAALRMLRTYAKPPSDFVSAAHRHVCEVDREIKALIRAGEIERQKSEVADPRAGLFMDRYLRKHVDVLGVEMPFGDEGSTVSDWVLRRVGAGQGMPDLPDLRRTFVSLGPRGPVSDRKFWLFALRCHAETAGVRLGLKRLSALANCADASYELDERTLARYFASLPPGFQAKCRRDFAECPPPSLIPSQHTQS